MNITLLVYKVYPDKHKQSRQEKGHFTDHEFEDIPELVRPFDGTSDLFSRKSSSLKTLCLSGCTLYTSRVILMWTQNTGTFDFQGCSTFERPLPLHLPAQSGNPWDS